MKLVGEPDGAQRLLERVVREHDLVPPLNNANQLAHVTGFLERAPGHAEITGSR